MAVRRTRCAHVWKGLGPGGVQDPALRTLFPEALSPCVQDPVLDELIRAAAAAPQAAPAPATGKWSSAQSPATGSASLLAALHLSSAAFISPLQLPVDMQDDTQVRPPPRSRASGAQKTGGGDIQAP